MTTARGEGGPVPPPRKPLAIPLALGTLLVALFVALGVWQVERRAWKLDLIAQVDRHLAAAPVAAPGLATRIVAADAYRRVSVRGRFRHDRETLVQALTERGAGWWVVTPLVADRGFTVLVNRGFVPQDRAAAASRPREPVAVTGLLRLTEPGGRFLRANDPGANRWYSRDVAAIARMRRLGGVAPYFIDADATPNPGGLPIGGLTVIAFRNTHLLYALTWFGLAALTAGAMVQLVRMRGAAL